MTGVPYAEHSAIVGGRGAVGVAMVLARAEAAGHLVDLDRETVAAITAITLAARAAQQRGIAGVGTHSAVAAARAAPSPSSSGHELLTVRQAMTVFGVKERRMRDIAAGIGHKVGGRWVLDPVVVADEIQRRGAA